MDSVTPSPTQTTIRYPTWRWIFPILYVAILVTPGWVFISARGGLGWFHHLNPTNWPGGIFPLFGLYALTLVWFQIMLGSLMPLWEKIFPKIFLFHRAEGIFALLFALTHPTLLLVSVGLRSFLARNFVTPELVKWVYFGYTAIFIMLLTVTTALVMQRHGNTHWWRKLHLLNYVLFASAWTHSYNIGTDIKSTGLHYLWFWYGATVLAVIIFKNTKFGRSMFARVAE